MSQVGSSFVGNNEGNMMKFIPALLLSLVLNTNAFAFTYGMFKVSIGSEVYEHEMIFLVNSAGQIKELENENWYDIESSLFFSELTLDIQGGGDEDFNVARITFKDNVIVDSCASFVDAKNKYVIKIGEQNLKVQRWNKYAKKYETVKTENEEFSESCFETLLAPFPYPEV